MGVLLNTTLSCMATQEVTLPRFGLHSLLGIPAPWSFFEQEFPHLSLFKTDGQLIYNAVLVSRVQQSDSVVHTQPFSDSFPTWNISHKKRNNAICSNMAGPGDDHIK